MKLNQLTLWGVKGDKILEQAYKTFKPERFNENAVEVCFVDLCYIKDYCNNPSDAWPIILESKASLNPYDNSDEWFATTDTSFFVDDKNPLRAAMIVYLMMQEQNNG